MTRREMLAAAGSATAFVSALKPAAAQTTVMKNFGVASTSFGARLRAGGGGRGAGGRGGPGGPGGAARGGAGGEAPAPPAKPIMPPFDIIEYAHANNCGEVETEIPLPDGDAIKKIRARLEAYNLRIITSPRLPQEPSDVPAYDAAVKNAKELGVYCMHAAMTARRYEEFDTLEQYQASFARNQKAVALAEPVLAKHKLRLAIENHKGWRAVEQAAWLKRMSSEWLCVHLDFGNNLSFCEDPMDTLKTLLPYIISCHIKDMAVQPYEDGFLLSEIPMGDGFLDLKGMVSILQKKDPNITFGLEMMTRDPLKIPVFTDKYWATFPDLPGRDLAHVLNLVRNNKPKYPLWYTTRMPLEAQVKLEEENNQKCIQWARQNIS